ncbi:hypothetical protein BY458DRAFT_431827 [Sporodiniella umbellata]|nr:hypothetical protein BY458DRAFT_431827 [Sporodiniella umbellata]
MTDQNKANEDDQDTTLLPPQVPTPPPPSSEDKASLLSPWWSEKPTTTNEEDTPEQPKTNTLFLFGINRSLVNEKDKDLVWDEKCYLVTNSGLPAPPHAKDKEMVERMFQRCKQCTMVCFLKESRKLTRQRALAESGKDKGMQNPFHGIWITVAKTPKRCKEHILQDTKIIQPENSPDYYNIDLGKEIDRSGEHATKLIHKTLRPLQNMSQLYIDSWKDGTQQAFFSKFWTRLQRGDAFYLVKDCTKRLLENVLEDKKPSDKK